MPLTPLHFGLLAPVNHWFPGKISLVSFTLINLWMDGNAILYYGFGLDQPEFHGPTTHSLVAALILATGVAIIAGYFRKGQLKWILGAYYGAVTHVLLDALVHSEMQPFYPLHWNPLYAGLMEPLSWILLPLMLWFIVQTVSSFGDWVRRRREAAADAAETDEPGNPGP